MKHQLKTQKSSHSVEKSVQLLLAALEKRNIEVFAKLDHSGGAIRSGLKLRDEIVIVFGDPKVGTLLMQENPAIGYELPLRVLIWEDSGSVVAYKDPLALVEEYGITDNKAIVEKMSKLMSMLVDEVIGALADHPF